MHLGKPNDALPYLKRALVLNPRSGEVGFYLGSALRDLRRHGEVYDVVKRVLEFDPQDLDLLALESLSTAQPWRRFRVFSSDPKSDHSGPVERRQPRGRSLFLALS